MNIETIRENRMAEADYLSSVRFENDEYERGVLECAKLITEALAVNGAERTLDALCDLVDRIEDERKMKLAERYFFEVKEAAPAKDSTPQ